MIRKVQVALVTATVFATLVSAETHVTTCGWGVARIGMSASEISAAMGAKLQLDDRFSESDDCLYMHSDRAPGIRFMFEQERLVRVETTDPRYSTPSGVRVGQSEASARRLYEGRAHIEPHKYDPTGSYLIIPAQDGKRAVVIETSEGEVVEIRGGSRPAVEYVEGCL